jgi:hypothetical protein
VTDDDADEPDLFADLPDPPAPKTKKPERPRCADCGRRTCEERGDATCIDWRDWRRRESWRLQAMLAAAMAES